MKKKTLKRNDIFKLDDGVQISIFKVKSSNDPIVNFKGSQKDIAQGMIFASALIAAQFMDDGVSEETVRKIFVDGIKSAIDQEIQEYRKTEKT